MKHSGTTRSYQQFDRGDPEDNDVLVHIVPENKCKPKFLLYLKYNVGNLFDKILDKNLLM